MPKDGKQAAARKPPQSIPEEEDVPHTEAASDTGSTTSASPTSSSSRTPAHSTIGALVSNLHHHDVQSLHQPLLESEERALRKSRHPHRSHGTERKPHSSLPRFVIDIEEETDAAVAAAAAAEGKDCAATGQEHEEHSNQSPSRRFSHFNLALRRFSHIHVHVNATYPLGSLSLSLCWCCNPVLLFLLPPLVGTLTPEIGLTPCTYCHTSDTHSAHLTQRTHLTHNCIAIVQVKTCMGRVHWI